MSEERKPLKHRHEGPDIAHGAESQERTTVWLQLILGTCIVLTCALMLYALLTANVDAPVVDNLGR